jgi:hypothetical protein
MKRMLEKWQEAVRVEQEQYEAKLADRRERAKLKRELVEKLATIEMIETVKAINA